MVQKCQYFFFLESSHIDIRDQICSFLVSVRPYQALWERMLPSSSHRSVLKRSAPGASSLCPGRWQSRLPSIQGLTSHLNHTGQFDMVHTDSSYQNEDTLHGVGDVVQLVQGSSICTKPLVGPPAPHGYDGMPLSAPALGR